MEAASNFQLNSINEHLMVLFKCLLSSRSIKLSYIILKNLDVSKEKLVSEKKLLSHPNSSVKTASYTLLNWNCLTGPLPLHLKRVK